MKLERLVRSGVVAMLFAGAWTMGCGAESPEVPDDDEEDEGGGTGGGGGVFPMGGVSGTAAGGVAGTPSGGVGGTPPTGGGGVFPMGGTGGTPSGGVSGTTATGGAGGMGVCGQTTATAADTSIDDLEDGENAIKMPRVGYWYTYNDMSAGCAQMPPPDPSGATPFAPASAAGNGAFAARTTGRACATWGAGMGFDLANCNSASGAYNAGVFSGITFWYKSTTAIRVIVATTDVIPSTRPPGTCVPGAGMGMECDNGHGLDLAAAPAGMTISVPFTMLSQAFGQQKPFDKTKIVNIQWQVAQALPFDFAIDDVAFTP